MGTIADKLQYLNDTKQAIKQAIIEKGQPVTGTDTFRSYADKIRAISGGGGGEVKKEITFYDYDGTVVKSYSIEEFASVTELPVPPEHEKLTFQEWNWSIEDIKASSKPMNIGALYLTKSGKTEFDITIVPPINKIVPIRIYNNVDGGLITVDWGDGTSNDATSTTIGNKGFSHTYANYGTYTISVDSTENYSLYGVEGNDQPIFQNAPSYLCTEARIGERCLEIMPCSLARCQSLQYISISNNISNIGAAAFKFCYGLKFIALPNGIENIMNHTFQDCDELESISISGSILNIREYAFNNCYRLKSIIIPNSVIDVGTYLYANCYSLKTAILSDKMNKVSLNMFYGCNQLESIVIPDGVERIDNNAFLNCFSLKSVVMSGSVKAVGTQMFASCYSLESVVLLEGVPSIGLSMFQSCYVLKHITIPKSVTSINNTAFNNCRSLESITIPEDVTILGTSVFNSCYSIMKYTFLSKVPPTLGATSVFIGINDLCRIEVPAESVAAYKSAALWNSYADRIVAIEE